MTPADVIAAAVRRRLPAAAVTVTPGPDGYAVVVRAAWRLVDPADRPAEVYRAFDRLPVDLVARVCRIDCPDA